MGITTLIKVKNHNHNSLISKMQTI